MSDSPPLECVATHLQCLTCKSLDMAMTALHHYHTRHMVFVLIRDVYVTHSTWRFANRRPAAFENEPTLQFLLRRDMQLCSKHYDTLWEQRRCRYCDQCQVFNRDSPTHLTLPFATSFCAPVHKKFRNRDLARCIHSFSSTGSRYD